MKIQIATPMYGGSCKADYVTSLLSLTSEVAKQGQHSIEYNFIYNESLITRARNSLVDMFLDSDADYLLFIDADQGFNTEDTIKMINSGMDIIGAIVPMKGINWESAIAARESGKKYLEPYTGFFNINLEPDTPDFSLLEPLEVKQVGTGMMLISRKVFEDLEPYCKKYARTTSDTFTMDFTAKPIVEYFTTSVDETGVLLSEDFNFCAMWKNLGNKVYVAPWVSVSHSGEYSFRGNFAQEITLAVEQSKLP